MSPDDYGSQREEEDREKALNAQRERALQSTLKPFGFCYFCNEPIRSGINFCENGKDGCVQDYENKLKMKTIRGEK